MFRLDKDDYSYSINECRAAVASKNKLLDLYEISDKLINNSNNIFIIFFRTIKSCILCCMPKDLALVLTWNKRTSLWHAPEKVKCNVLWQAEEMRLRQKKWAL
jgi:hypothetical protein